VSRKRCLGVQHVCTYLYRYLLDMPSQLPVPGNVCTHTLYQPTIRIIPPGSCPNARDRVNHAELMPQPGSFDHPKPQTLNPTKLVMPKPRSGKFDHVKALGPRMSTSTKVKHRVAWRLQGRIVIIFIERAVSQETRLVHALHQVPAHVKACREEFLKRRCREP
jgi:hypothetical protein